MKLEHQEKITVKQNDAIAVITLNSPERKNAFSMEMCEQLIAALESAYENNGIGAIILTGAGGEFCAGGDISSMGDGYTVLEARDRMIRFNNALQVMVGGSKPIIAAVEGRAFGAGMSIALACDYIVAAKESTFCSAFARVGLMPDMGLLWTLTQRAGMTKAKELITLAIDFSGAEAEALGIVNRAVKGNKVQEIAHEIALQYTKVAPLAFSIVKSAFADGTVQSLAGTISKEADNQPILRNTQDHKDAVAKFLNKRRGSRA